MSRLRLSISTSSTRSLRQFLRYFVLPFFGDCIFLCSPFSPHYVPLSVLPSSAQFFDCLLPSLNAAFPSLCHLLLISANNDCDLALVQSYKLIMHTECGVRTQTHNKPRARVLSKTL